MDAIDAGYPRLYRSGSLTIRPTPNLLTGGEFHDDRGLRVGHFSVRVPENGRWGDHAARTVTEIADGDGTQFMLVVHRGRDHVMADPDGTVLATLRPNLQLLGQPLRVRVMLVDHGDGSLRESRRARKKTRTYELTFESVRAAQITARLGNDENAELTLVHDPAASPPQRCAALALATCVPQMIMTGPTVGGSGYGG